MLVVRAGVGVPWLKCIIKIYNIICDKKKDMHARLGAQVGITWPIISFVVTMARYVTFQCYARFVKKACWHSTTHGKTLFACTQLGCPHWENRIYCRGVLLKWVSQLVLGTVQDLQCMPPPRLGQGSIVHSIHMLIDKALKPSTAFYRVLAIAFRFSFLLFFFVCQVRSFFTKLITCQALETVTVDKLTTFKRKQTGKKFPYVDPHGYWTYFHTKLGIYFPSLIGLTLNLQGADFLLG